MYIYIYILITQQKQHIKARFFLSNLQFDYNFVGSTIFSVSQSLYNR